MCSECGCGINPQSNIKEIKVFTNILNKNDEEALKNKEHLGGIFCMNFMGSPGCGKTTLLEALIDKNTFKLGVVEGDLETNLDAIRIQNKGAYAYQVSTGQTCHLDAKMVHHALHHLPLEKLDLVVIENVGNLVCPASYKLGEDINVAFVSVPEGSDKVAKYPVMFKNADVLIISKVGLLEHFDFNIEDAKLNAKKLNPNIKIFCIDSKNGNGVDEFCSFIKEQIKTKKGE